MKLNKWYIPTEYFEYPHLILITEIVHESQFYWQVNGYLWYNFKYNSLDFKCITDYTIIKSSFFYTFLPLEQHR